MSPHFPCTRWAIQWMITWLPLPSHACHTVVLGGSTGFTTGVVNEWSKCPSQGLLCLDLNWDGLQLCCMNHRLHVVWKSEAAAANRVSQGEWEKSSWWRILKPNWTKSENRFVFSPELGTVFCGVMCCLRFTARMANRSHYDGFPYSLLLHCIMDSWKYMKIHLF